MMVRSTKSSPSEDREQEIQMEGPGGRKWTEDSVRGALVKIREAVLRANLKAEIVTATLDEEDKARLLITKEIEDETFYSWANLDNVIQRLTDDSEPTEVDV